MGFLRYVFDNEWTQRADIDAQSARLTRQSIQARAERRRLREDVDARVKALEDDLGEMALFVRTLYRVLVEKGSIDRAAFLEAMKAVDASDGAADGKYTGPMDTP